MTILSHLYSRLRGVPTARILGNDAGATGPAQALTPAEARTVLQLGTAALSASGDFDVSGAAAASVSAHVAAADPHADRAYAVIQASAAYSAAVAASQPLDSDLTAIAALSTTAFGRSLLEAANAAAVRTLIGAGTSSFDGIFSSLTGKPTTLSGYGITDAQPLDSDLTAIAALSTTAFGRSLLEAANAAALRTLAGLVIGTDVQAYDAELAALAGLTSAANKLPYFTGSGAAALADFTGAGRALIDDADAAAQRTTLGLGGAAVLAVGTTAGTVAAGDDSRLTDSRTPTAHATSHASAGSDPLTIAESQVTNLTTDLAAKAPLASPALTGTPTAPTAAAATNTTQIATTAFVLANGAVPNLPVGSKSADYTLLAADKGKLISFTATANAFLTAAATLGDGWWAIVENAISGSSPASIVTIDPNGAETCDALTTVTQYIFERRLILCNGTGFTSRIMRPHRRISYTASGIYIVPPDNRGAKTRVFGGGASGAIGQGAAAGNSRYGSSGGGAGACHEHFSSAAELGAPGTSITITVAAQTAAGTGTTGSVGGNSSFGSLVTGYGGGPGIMIAGAGNRGGGSGGGVAGVGAVGTNGYNYGGLPAPQPASFSGGGNSGGGGAHSYPTLAGGFAEFGGASGGGSPSTIAAGLAGGGSQHGGGGGGSGGGISAANAAFAPGVGGATGDGAAASGGGGTAGTSGATSTVGGNGADGTNGAGGQGGGGGGSDTDSAGSVGGDGGAPGGGGGGGGGGTSTGGNGGKGARGQVDVEGV